MLFSIEVNIYIISICGLLQLIGFRRKNIYCLELYT